MGKLNVVSYKDFVLEGEFERIKAPDKTVLDEESVITAIKKFKDEKVSLGYALGTLNEGFLVMPTEDGDQVVEENRPPAFMIIDIQWNSERKSIVGTVIILDSPDGEKIKNAIMQGTECYISYADTDSYLAKDENSSSVLLKISEIRGFKISIMSFHNTI